MDSGTFSARGLTVATASLGLVHLEGALAERESPYLAPMSLALSALALFTVARLSCGGCFEARLAAAVLALASVLAAALVATVGPPGGTPTGLTFQSVSLLLIGAAALVLLGMDRGRRTSISEAKSSYASGHVPPRDRRRGRRPDRGPADQDAGA